MSLEFILAMIIYGSIGIFAVKVPMPSLHMVLVRTFLGGIFLYLIILFKKVKPDRKLLKENLPLLTLSGAVMGLSWLFLFEAYNHTSVSMATLLYYLAPVITILLSPIVLKEKLTSSKLIAIFLAALGMYLTSRKSLEVGSLNGVIFGLLSAVFYASLMLLNKRLKPGLPGLTISFYQVMMAFFTLLISYFIFNKEPFVIPQGLGFVYLMILSIVHTALACALYFSGMQKMPGQMVALFSYIDPVSALILSFIFLNERLGPLEILGAVLILGGAIYGEVADRRKTSKLNQEKTA